MKILGYILSIVGILAIATMSVPKLKTILKIPETFPQLYITIVGAILVLAGIVILMKSGKGRSGKQAPEVPIYKGKNIVGYRQH